MLAHQHSTHFRRFTSVAAIGFLLWTLSSATFLDASSNFVERKLYTLKKLSDRTTQQVEMMFLHGMR